MSDPNQLAHRNADDGIVWIKVSAQEMDLYGTDPSVQDILTCRLPESVAEQCSPGVWNQCRFASGVRLRFGTDSPRILLRAMYGKFYESIYMNYFGLFGFDLYKCESQKNRIGIHLFRYGFSIVQVILFSSTGHAQQPPADGSPANCRGASILRELLADSQIRVRHTEKRNVLLPTRSSCQS